MRRGLGRITTRIQLSDIKDTAFIDIDMLKLVVILPNRCIEATIINVDFTISRSITVLEGKVCTIDNVKLQISCFRNKIDRINRTVGDKPRVLHGVREMDLSENLGS